MITVRGPGVGARACPGPPVMIIGRLDGRVDPKTGRGAAPIRLTVSGRCCRGTSRAARWSSATSVPLRRMYPAAWRAHDCISRCGCDTRPWRRRGGDAHGRVAQRESTRFTPGRSAVRTRPRPPRQDQSVDSGTRALQPGSPGMPKAIPSGARRKPASGLSERGTPTLRVR